ncbi:MAG: hypothetical protein K8F30_00830, partial [Taibaiella sp.]|nr:hypothetical protein [Taibaiella sp.]
MSFWDSLFGRNSPKKSTKAPNSGNEDSEDYFSLMSEKQKTEFIESVDKSIRYENFRSFASEQVLSNSEIKEYCTYWLQERNPYNPPEITRYSEVVQIKRDVRQYCDELVDAKFNKESKTWQGMEIERQFWVIRCKLISVDKPFPTYLWNLVSGTPFSRVYPVCRDYA